jgi:hypothetical protein
VFKACRIVFRLMSVPCMKPSVCRSAPPAHPSPAHSVLVSTPCSQRCRSRTSTSGLQYQRSLHQRKQPVGAFLDLTRTVLCTLGGLIRLRILSGTGHHRSSPLTLRRSRLPRHLYGTAACCVQQVQLTAGACRPAVDRSSERTVQRRSKAPLPPSSTGTGTGTTPGVSRSARTGCQQQSATHRSVEGCVTIDWTAGAGVGDFRIRLIRSAGKARPPVSTFTRTPYVVQVQAQSDQAQQTGCLQPSSSTCQRLCPEASLARVDLRCITACPGTAAGPPCGTID